MSRAAKQVHPELEPQAVPALRDLVEMSQVDFELDFYGRILARHPEFFEALRAHAANLAGRMRYAESLQVERRIIQLRPKDPLAHYNLACSYALLRQSDLAIGTLRKALELGYHDFGYIRQDRDLDSIRRDPRFKKLMREFGDR